MYVARQKISSGIDRVLELTAEKKEIREAKINAKFSKTAQQFKKTLRDTGCFDPKGAFVRFLEAQNVDPTTIEVTWMALTSTDMIDS